MRITRLAVVAVCATIGLSGVHVAAQGRGLGRINGTITSDSGDAVSGVAIKVDVAGGALESKSDGSGHWVVTGLGKGDFTAEFSKAGFETKRIKLTIQRETMQSEPIKIALKKS